MASDVLRGLLPGLALLLAAACGRDDDAPPPPAGKAPAAAAARAFREEPVDAPPEFARLLPKNTTLYTQISSIREAEARSPWLFPLLLSSRLRTAARASGVKDEDLALDRPLGFAWALPPGGFDDALTVLVVPVRGTGGGGAKEPEDVRVHGGYRAKGNRDSWTVGTELPAAARALPDGVVSGRRELGPAMKQVTEGLAEGWAELVEDPPAELERFSVAGIMRGLAALSHITWAAKPEQGALTIDATLYTEPGGPLDTDDDRRSPIGDLLRCIPEGYPLVFGYGSDLRRVADLLEPLAKLAIKFMPELGDDTGLEALRQLDRGAVGGFRFGKRVVEGVVIANARNPTRFLELYLNSIKLQSRAQAIRFLPGGTALVAGVEVRKFFLGIDFRAMAAQPDPAADRFGTLLAFRASGRSGSDEARLAAVEADADAIRRRVAADGNLDGFTVEADPDYLFLRPPLSMLSRGDPRTQEAAARNLLTPATGFRICPVIPRAHPSYAECRALLEQALAATNAPDKVAAANADAVWYPLAGGELADAQRGYVLVSNKAAALDPADLDWAYVSDARLGEHSLRRDVHLRWSATAASRLVGAAHVMIFGDRAFILGNGPLDQIIGLYKPEAATLVAAMTRTPLGLRYEYEGRKSLSFAMAYENRKRFEELVGKRGLALRLGAVGNRVFALLGGTEADAERTIAAIRSASGAAPSSWQHTPDADFFVALDLERFAAGIAELMAAVMGGDGPAAPANPFELPEGLDPIVFGAWHHGPEFRLRLRVDERLGQWLHERTEEDRLARARRSLANVRTNVERWQQESDVTRIPSPEELHKEVLDSWERLDAWGNGFRLDWRDEGYVVRCAGPDGLFDTDDDITDR